MLNSFGQPKHPFRAISTLQKMIGAKQPPRIALPKVSEREIDELSKRVILPSLPVSDEEMARATHQDGGQKLVRQDRWEELSARIRHADQTRLTTPAGEAASLLLAFGARSDVVSAAEDALHDGKHPDPEALFALESVLEDYPEDYPCALVVALAHLDIACAWHGIRFDQEPKTTLIEAQSHLRRAEQVLQSYNGQALDSPSLMAAHCALAATHDRRGLMLVEDYASLIAADPRAHGHMRALGRHMTRFLRKHPNALELAARRTMALTDPIWSSGGYAWVYLDALLAEPAAISLLDADFFIEGMEHIIRLSPDQHIINQFAAFCAIAMAPQPDIEHSQSYEAQTRARLHNCIDWIVADHLQELHPLIWSQTMLAPSHVPSLPSRRALVVNGRQTALRIIAARFAKDIENGGTIAFSAHGMYRLPSI